MFLSALGIAIGIAAMIGVVGISTSSRAELERTLTRLGTNLLTIGPGQSFFGDNSHLPQDAIPMISRIGPVTAVSATGRVANKHVYRNDHIPPGQTGGISVLAAKVDLPGTVGATVASGTWLNPATARYPAVVLGSKAADRLGISAAGPDVRVWLGGRWCTVVGIFDPVPLAPELDVAALIGWDAAGTRPRSTPGLARTPSSRSATCSPPPPTRPTRTRSRCPARPTRSPPSRPPTRP